MHSFIVLQHVPTRTGRTDLRDLASLVAPGGVGVVHVPIAASHWLAHAHTWATRTIPFAYNVANLLRGRPWAYPHMQMNVYQLNPLASDCCARATRACGWRSIPARRRGSATPGRC